MDPSFLLGPGSFPVVGVSPPIRIETSSTAISEGQTLDLNCLVAGQSQATVMWYKREGALPVHSQVRAFGDPDRKKVGGLWLWANWN